MATGVVKWFSTEKGYGSIMSDDGGPPEVFVHWAEIRATDGRKDLVEGERVDFTIARGPKGPQAEQVTPIG
ncbi:cold shock domain-containing protein [Streptomyces goshikiensis]|uniref:cold-shock protein n=1 Tax=Streptomyces goshikiensis TaxID=1942 RepID=UPI00340C8538